VKYFYTMDHPHRPTSGPIIFLFDEENGYEDIKSLARAKQLAEEAAVDSFEDDRVVTSYGVIHGEFR